MNDDDTPPASSEEEKKLEEQMLLIKDSNMKKRNVVFEDNKNTLFIFRDSKCTDLEAEIHVREMTYIGLLTQQDIEEMNLRVSPEKSPYFVIRTFNKQRYVFCTLSEHNRKKWVDTLSISKEAFPEELLIEDTVLPTPAEEASQEISQPIVVAKKVEETENNLATKAVTTALEQAHEPVKVAETPKEILPQETLPKTEVTTIETQQVPEPVKTVEAPKDASPSAKKAPSKATHRPSIIKPKDTLTLLGIENENETPNEKTMLINDLSLVKNGTQRMLIQLSGKSQRADQIECKPALVNIHGVYILDAGNTIYQFNGEKASRFLKAKGLELSNTIKYKERGGAAEVVVVNQGQEKDEDEKKKAIRFWKEMGGQPEEMAATPLPEPEVNFKMFRVAESKQRAKKVTPVQLPATKIPSKDQLNTKYAYVLDCPSELFVWTGKGSTLAQRKMAMLVAQKMQADYAAKNIQKYVTKVIEHGEHSMWKEKLTGYQGMLPIQMSAPTPAEGNVSKKRDQPDCTPLKLFDNPPKSIENTKQQIVTQGGATKIWVIRNFNKVEYPAHLYGHFYAGESYVICMVVICFNYVLVYTFKQENKGQDSHVIYYWQGRDTDRRAQGASALLAVGVDDKVDGTSEQIRIVQNKEPSHFLTIFKNNYVIHRGNFDRDSTSTAKLYQIAGTSEVNCRAIEVDNVFFFAFFNNLVLHTIVLQSLLYCSQCHNCAYLDW